MADEVEGVALMYGETTAGARVTVLQVFDDTCLTKCMKALCDCGRVYEVSFTQLTCDVRIHIPKFDLPFHDHHVQCVSGITTL